MSFTNGWLFNRTSIDIGQKQPDSSVFLSCNFSIHDWLLYNFNWKDKFYVDHDCRKWKQEYVRKLRNVIMFISVEPVWRDFVQVQNATQVERVDKGIFAITKTRQRLVRNDCSPRNDRFKEYRINDQMNSCHKLWILNVFRNITSYREITTGMEPCPYKTTKNG